MGLGMWLLHSLGGKHNPVLKDKSLFHTRTGTVPDFQNLCVYLGADASKQTITRHSGDPFYFKIVACDLRSDPVIKPWVARLYVFVLGVCVG